MIWLIGNRGMLGSDVEALMISRGIPFCATDIDLDITDPGALRKYASQKKISWIINCSAYTAVDRAEDEPDLAGRVNGDGIRNIAAIAREKDARLIHFSTDYVFDGLKDGGYSEDDATNPMTVYGLTKLKGERLLAETWQKHFIFRISWLFGKMGNNFVYTMIRLFNDRNVVKVVNDQMGSPTYTRDLAGVLLGVIGLNSEHYGIYHYSCSGKISWFDFARAIYEKAKKYNLVQREVSIVPIPTSEFPTKARRPANSYLSKDKISRQFKLTIPSWEDQLESFFSEIKNDPRKG